MAAHRPDNKCGFKKEFEEQTKLIHAKRLILLYHKLGGRDIPTDRVYSAIKLVYDHAKKLTSGKGIRNMKRMSRMAEVLSRNSGKLDSYIDDILFDMQNMIDEDLFSGAATDEGLSCLFDALGVDEDQVHPKPLDHAFRGVLEHHKGNAMVSPDVPGHSAPPDQNAGNVSSVESQKVADQGPEAASALHTTVM